MSCKVAGLFWNKVSKRLKKSGSFVQNGLVDEISIILAPIANGDLNGHRFFVAKEPYFTMKETAFELKSVEQLEHGTLWIGYTPKQTIKK